MDRSIVVGTDLSESADEALRQAHAWARWCEGPLVVCHVMPDLVHIHSLLPHLAARETAAAPLLQKRVAWEIFDRAASVTQRRRSELDVVITEGSPAAQLIQLAEERRARLVVVGVGGREPFERALLGTTAEQVVRHAHCPVLVARRSPRSGVVLVGTDFSEGCGAVLEAAAEAARGLGAKLSVMHSIDVMHPLLASIEPLAVLPSDSMNALRTACREVLDDARAKVKATGEALVTEGPPASAIVRVAHDLGAELVVVGTHGATGLRRLALGSVAVGVLRKVPCSLLVVRS